MQNRHWLPIHKTVGWIAHHAGLVCVLCIWHGKIIIFRCMQTIISQGVDFTAALHPTRAANEQSAKFSQSQRMPLLGPFLGWNQLLALSHKTLLRLRTFVWTLEALSDTHSCYCDIVERVFVMLECYKMRTDFVKMCLSEAPISHVAA